MASRVAEVIYKLKDLFSGPVRKIEAGYERVRKSSRKTADQVERQNRRMGDSFGFVTGRVKAFVAGFGTLLTGRALVGGISSTADELDRLGKAAAKLSIDPSDLAALEFAAERSGVAVSKVEKALFTLQKRTGEAAQGIGAARVAFEDFGINVEEFAELNAVEQLELLADAFQGLEGEERAAANAAALFSKEAGGELIKVLNQGSGAIREYVNQAKEFRDVTAEATKAAADYNDALTNLGTAAEGIKFRAFTPVIQSLNQLAGVAGLAGSRTVELEAKIEDTRRKIEGFNEELNPDAVERWRAELALLENELEGITQAQEDAAESSRELAAERDAARQVDADYQAGLESLTDTLDDQAKTAQRNLEKETRELEAARRKQLSIEEEFANLRKEVTAVEAEDVSGLDVQLKALEAKRQLEQGNADAAIEAAREGGDLLRTLKDQGDEAGFVLSFLAKELERVASSAAQSQTAPELVDVSNAEKALEGINTQLEQLKSDAATQGTEIGKALVASIQQELNFAQLKLPEVVREGIRSLDGQTEKQAPR